MRHTKAPERLIEIFETEIERTNRHYVAYEVLAQPVDIEPDIDYLHPALAFAASSNPDIMYFHEVMRQPDRAQFLKAAVKEIDDQTENGNWRVIRADTVPEGATVLPAVWQCGGKDELVPARYTNGRKDSILMDQNKSRVCTIGKHTLQ